MTIPFYKYQGTGNDFIIIDSSKYDLQILKKHIVKLCDRKFGVGSDGLIIIKTHKEYDFEMQFFNPDGSKSFCGNGSRCAALYCYHQGLVQSNCSFLTNDGDHTAKIFNNDSVMISIIEPVSVNKLSNGDFTVNTGSPHYIQFNESLKNLNFLNHCKSIRNNDAFIKEGINVNIVKKLTDGIEIRTYERGVENETLSCGSGVTAAALVFAYQNQMIKNSVNVNTKGGSLKVDFKRESDFFKEVYLTGPSKFVFSGEFHL